eukprot:TRINITY_DN1192_c0_g1_i1.p1 TRINITY_DN1192_c0_g1~~TRINITY_DN1192_c0_g1_i1.p1  ORF type:complete len:661 (+),score=79.20 TRINITY_DN1192_c0_g1_i1:469-2451(+)
MPSLVGFSGDEDFRGVHFTGYMDPSVYLSFLPRMEVLCLPRKRLRSNPPSTLWEPKPKQQKSSLSLDMLPEECLFEIFKRVPGGRDRSSCACVSKRWLTLQSTMRRTDFKVPENQVSRPHGKNGFQAVSVINGDSDGMELDDTLAGEEQDSTFGDLSRCLEGKKATDVRLAAISVGMGNRWGLGKLKIRGNNPVRGVTDEGLAAVGNGCPALRELSLWDCPLIGDKGLVAIAKGCPLLEKLDLLNCPLVTDAALEAVAENCPKLSLLNLESCPLIGNKSLLAVAQCCEVKVLSVTNCMLVSDEGILPFASSNITKLKLQGLGVTDLSLEAIGRSCTDLMELVLTNLQNLSQQGFQKLGRAGMMQKLKVFSIGFCKGLTDLSLGSIGQGCPGLKQASFHKCDISDQGLKAFTKPAISLENLLLDECNMISLTGLVDGIGNSAGKLKVLTIVKCFNIREGELKAPVGTSVTESLKCLNVRNCPAFGNGCLALLGAVCPQVHSVDLSGLTKISDDGLLTFLGGIKTSLVKLNLSSCVEVTDRVVFVIANLFGPTLQCLNLEGCRKLTDQSLKFIANCCPVLQELDISKSSITDHGLLYLAMTKNHNLQVLSLAGCSYLTDNSVPFIAKMSDGLHGLNLQHCRGISSKVLDSLLGSLWRCDILA